MEQLIIKYFKAAQLPLELELKAVAEVKEYFIILLMVLSTSAFLAFAIHSINDATFSCNACCCAIYFD